MGAVRLLAWSDLRHRWSNLLGFTLIVALVGTAVLGSLGGARRTATAVDRLRDATAARDAGAFVTAYGEPVVDDLAQGIGSLDGVTEVAGAAIVVTDASFDVDVVVRAPLDEAAFNDIDRPVLLDGRLPRPQAENEVVVNEAAAELLGLGTGDRFQARTFSLEDCDALAAQRFQGVNGPELDLRVVGEVRQLDDLVGGRSGVGPVLIAGPAFIPAHPGTCAATVEALVRYGDDGGPSTAALLSATRRVGARLREDTGSRQPGAGENGAYTIEDQAVDDIDAAVHVALVALLAFAAVAGLAGCVGGCPSGDASHGVGRRSLDHPRGDRHDRPPSPRRMAAPVVVAGVVGATMGVLGAAVASGLFPIGLARRAEPHPGFGPNLGLLLVGFGALIAVVAVLAPLAARRSVTAHGRRPAWLAGVARRAGTGPVVVVGLRLTGDAERGRPAVRTALLGSIVAIAGVSAVVVLSLSLTETMDRPERYGWPWSVQPDMDVPDPEATAAEIAEEEEIAALGRLDEGVIEVDGTTAAATALDVRKGTIAFEISEGRHANSPDEIALGLESLTGVEVGDSVTVVGDDGVGREFAVVGRSVLPENFDGAEALVTLTSEALGQLTADLRYALLLTYAPGVDREALEARIGPEFSLTFPSYARPVPPGRLLHLEDVRGLLIALAAFFALLGLIGQVHAVVTSNQRNRGLLAALWSLGFRRRQIGASIVVCATGIVVVAAVVGVPVGVAVGRLAWSIAVDGIGILVAPVTPVGPLVVASVGAVALAVAVSAPLAWFVAHRLSADALRAE